MQDTIAYREIKDTQSMLETIQLQASVWGEDAVVPLSQMIASIHNGGVVIGAYRKEALIGFCYGFPGCKDQEMYLCSHMLAVHPDFRNLGLGRTLKLQQRKWALDYGYRKMVWTYDPLETRNGFLNLCKLGGYVKTYLPSYYGEMKDKLNVGLQSDRFLLEWDLDSTRARYVEAGETICDSDWNKYSMLYTWEKVGGFPSPVIISKEWEEAKGYLLPVPESLQELKKQASNVAKTWRFASRSYFIEAFSRGYAVVGLIRRNVESVNYYVIEKWVV